MKKQIKSQTDIILKFLKNMWLFITYSIEKNIDKKAQHAIKHKINFKHKTEFLEKVEHKKVLKKKEKTKIVNLIDAGTDFRTHRKSIMALMVQHPSPKICNKLIESDFFRPLNKFQKDKNKSEYLMQKAWQFNEIALVCAFFNNEVASYFKYRTTDEDQTRSSKQFIYEKNLIRSYDKLFPYIKRAFNEDELCDGKGYSPLGQDCVYNIDKNAVQIIVKAAKDFKDEVIFENIAEEIKIL